MPVTLPYFSMGFCVSLRKQPQGFEEGTWEAYNWVWGGANDPSILVQGSTPE